MNNVHLKFNKKLLGSTGEFELNIDVRFGLGECIALFGKSGAGKSTLLRILSGLESADSGYIRVGEEIWLDSQKGINIPPQKRYIGFVFQNYALFPHLNVYENICFGLNKKNHKTFADELLEIMELENLKKSKIHQLSSGQAQRVALARAIASSPKLLLLDEPFSALDLAMRQKLQAKIKEVQQHFNLTILFASHHIGEIFALCSSMLIICKGQISAQGTPNEIFHTLDSKNSLDIMGEVVGITDSDIQILHHDKILTITRESTHENIQVGEQVLIRSEIYNPTIRRL